MSERTTTAERIAFGVFLVLTASLAIQKPSVLNLAGKALTATDLVFPFLLLASGVAFILRERTFVWRPIYWFFASYIAAFVVASLFAPDRYLAFIKTSATTYLVMIAVIAIELVNTSERIKAAMLTLLAASAIPVLVGLATLVLFYLIPDSSLLPHLTYHYGAVPVGNYPRLSSSFVSASMFCNYLNVVLMLVLIARAKGWIVPHLSVMWAASITICALFTISSGSGAFFVALGLWIWFSRPAATFSRLALFLGIAVGLLFFVSSFVALQRHATAPYSFQIPIVGIEAYPSPRLMVWTEATNNFINNFLVGSGPGTPSAAVMFQNSEGTHSLLTDAHNTYLSIATQTGIPGSFAVLALTIYLLKIGLRRSISTLRYGLGAAFFTAFVVQGFTSSFEDARHLWLLIGLLVAALRLEEDELPAQLGSGA